VPRIDAHVHVTPAPLLEELGRVFGDRPSGVVPSTPDDLRELMTRYALDGVIVSAGPPGAFLGDQARANELARALNEEVAAVRASNPSRVAALATLPLPDVDAALGELRHALDELELDGVFLLSNVAGTYLGDPQWDALFDELERRGAYAFVHPGFPPHPLPLEHPVWLYEFPFDTTRAVAHMIFSGTLERCPNVKIQLAHLGGAAPFLAHRIASLADRMPHAAQAAPAGALDYLARLYYDTGLSNNAVALASTLEVAPLEHVVFGTDWPYAVLPPEGDDPAPGLATMGSERRARIESSALHLVPRFSAL
jgi:predicted TIM-barrel fold metal-dependent hydrolase